MDAADKASQLREHSARQREVLIEADIETAMTFLRLAATELDMGHTGRAAELAKKAKQAYHAVAKLLVHVTSVRKQELRKKWRALDVAISDLERQRRKQ